jgi:hypothetical protein
VQILKSSKLTNVSAVTTIEEGKIGEMHAAFLDWNSIYFEIQKFNGKTRRVWQILTFIMFSFKKSKGNIIFGR